MLQWFDKLFLALINIFAHTGNGKRLLLLWLITVADVYFYHQMTVINKIVKLKLEPSLNCVHFK